MRGDAKDPFPSADCPPRCSLPLLLSYNRLRAEIHYSVSLAHPEQHLFHVSVEVPDVQDHVNLQMAAWNALYQIRDFSSHVQHVYAAVNGQSAPVEKLDKLTWRVKGTGTVKLTYDTFWDDTGPFNTQLNSEHAFINPAMILLYVPSRGSEAVSISFRDWPRGWQFATSLEPLFSDDPSSSFRVFLAPNFNALADAPIEACTFAIFQLSGLSTAYLRRHSRRQLQKAVTSKTRYAKSVPMNSS